MKVPFDAWMTLALAGWVISVGLHLVTWLAPLHHYVYVAEVAALFPVFAVAVWRHPRRETIPGGAEVPAWHALRRCPLWLHAVVWGSLAYSLAIASYLGVPDEFSLGRVDDARGAHRRQRRASHMLRPRLRHDVVAQSANVSAVDARG